MPDHEACDVSIKMRQPVKAAVEQPGEPFPAARDQIPGGRRPLLLVRKEDLRSQCRRQGQRTEAGDCCRDRDGDRELLEELPGNATEKRGRHEHRAQHQRDRDQRAADLLHGLQRGVAPAQAVREMPLDILDHDNGVVDHDANREHKAEQREIVDAIAEGCHGRKGTNQRHRDRHDRDDRRTPALQEHQHHDDNQCHRFIDGLDQLADGLPDELGRVVADIVVEPLGKTGLQLGHRVLDALCGRKRVRSGPLGHQHRDRGLPQLEAVGGVVERAELDPRDVAQPHDAAVLARFDDDVFKLGWVLQPSGKGEVRLEGAVGNRRARKLTARDLQILGADRGDDVACEVMPRLAILSGSSHSRIE